jgi:NADH:ubiquinone oxidoreductase subunit B-like Fe-S oxidoreductase
MHERTVNNVSTMRKHIRLKNETQSKFWYGSRRGAVEILSGTLSKLSQEKQGEEMSHALRASSLMLIKGTEVLKSAPHAELCLAMVMRSGCP